MKIKEQNSGRDIYNIKGNLILENSPDVIDILHKQNQEQLKSQFSISFNKSLQNQMAGKILISRDETILDISKKLDENFQVLVHGEPGIGKTTIIYQFIQSRENIIYISLKGKSALSVISYLTNKIRALNKEDLIEFDSLIKAFNTFQVELQKTRETIVIDDCERDIEFIKEIIQLDKFDSKFLFLSRNHSSFETENIDFYPIKCFSEDDVKEFLLANSITIGHVKFNELYFASKGNPLYLFYYSQMQLSPLPKDVQNYQNAIWKNLDSTTQELLIFISIAFSPLTLKELSELMKYDSPIKLSEDIDNLSSLVKVNDGTLTLFHPSFNEHVLSFLGSKGLKNTYQERLGDFFLEKEDYIQATYSLIDFAPQKVKKYLLDVFPVLINIGELEFAIKVLNTILSLSKKKFYQGYAHYHLCSLYRLIGRPDESNAHIDSALDNLKNIDEKSDKRYYISALMFKAINNIEDGKVNEGLEIANKVLLDINALEKEFKATILVNLSKIYTDLFEFEKGAIACKEAFEIFEEDNFEEGMLSSLTNLVTCLGQIEGYLNDAEKYGLRLLKLLEDKNEFMKEVIVLNALTSIYRQKGDYKEALKYGDRVIKLCQEYGMKDKVILNLVNYGNVLRDDERTSEALKIYNEALVYAKEYKLEKEEGRIYWILAGIERDKSQYTESIIYAEKSISINKRVNFYYGVANAYNEKAKTLIEKGVNVEAAKMLEESAEYYLKIEYFANSYQERLSEAVRLYKNEGKNDDVNRVLNKLISSVPKRLKPDSLSELILETSSSNDAILKSFDNVFELYFKENNTSNLTLFFLDYLVFCQSLEINTGKTNYLKTLDLIIDNLGITKFSYSILGIAIQQSRNLLDNKNLNYINKRLQTTLPLYNIRNLSEEYVFITSINQLINLEIHTFNDELTCMKLAMMLILILNEHPQIIENGSKEKLENFCNVWILSYSEEMEKVLGEYIGSSDKIFSEMIQSVHAEKNDYEIQDMIIIGEDFDEFSDINNYPDNKVSLYFFVMSIAGIKGHFYHEDIRDNSEKRQEILQVIANMYDYKSTEGDTLNSHSAYNINFDSLEI